MSPALREVLKESLVLTTQTIDLEIAAYADWQLDTSAVAVIARLTDLASRIRMLLLPASELTEKFYELENRIALLECAGAEVTVTTRTQEPSGTVRLTVTGQAADLRHFHLDHRLRLTPAA